MNKFFLILIQMTFVFAANAKTDIELVSEVKLSDRLHITLADVIPASILDKNFLEQAKNILLSEVNFQEKVNLDKDQIVKLVRENTELQKLARTNKYNLKFPETIQIEILQGKYSKEEFETLIQRELLSQCSECRFQISIAQLPKFLNKDWEIDFSNLKIRNSFLLPVKVNINQKSENFFVSGQLRVFQMGFVAKRMVIQGQKISDDDIEEKELEITSFTDALAPQSEIKGKIATRNINVKSPVTFSLLKKEFTVKRGQSIRALIGNDQFEVSMQMQLDSDGYVGDKVRVKSLDNQKQFLGTVLSAEAVKIE